MTTVVPFPSLKQPIAEKFRVDANPLTFFVHLRRTTLIAHLGCPQGHGPQRTEKIGKR